MGGDTGTRTLNGGHARTAGARTHLRPRVGTLELGQDWGSDGRRQGRETVRSGRQQVLPDDLLGHRQAPLRDVVPAFPEIDLAAVAERVGQITSRNVGASTNLPGLDQVVAPAFLAVRDTIQVADGQVRGLNAVDVGDQLVDVGNSSIGRQVGR